MAIANDVDIWAATVVVGRTTFLTQWQLMRELVRQRAIIVLVVVTKRWHENK